MTYDYPIWYIFISLLISGLLSFLMYRKNIKTSWKFSFMAFLRFTSLMLIMLALGSLMLTSVVRTKVKPKLVLAFDQSSSMLANADVKDLETVFSEFNSSEIKSKFNLLNIGFGKIVSEIDTLNFNQTRTSFEDIEGKLKNIITDNDIVVLVSDGNVNLGSTSIFSEKKDYRFDIIGIGDTVSSSEISIKRINYNKQVVVGNTFPVELFVETSSFSGDLKLKVIEGNRVIYSDLIRVLSNNINQKLRHSFVLKSTTKGVHTYDVQLSLAGTDLLKPKKISVDFVENKGLIFIKFTTLNPDISLFKRKLKDRNYKVVVSKQVPKKADLKKFDFAIDFDNSIKNNLLPIITVTDRKKTTRNSHSGMNENIKFLKLYSVSSDSNKIEIVADNLWKYNLEEAKNGENKLDKFFDLLVRDVELLRYTDKFNIVFKDIYTTSENVILKLINESSKIKSVNAKVEIEINEKKETFNFIGSKGEYELNLGKLDLGDYSSEIIVDGKKLKDISFEVKDINLESLGIGQNLKLLNEIISTQNGNLYSLKNYKVLIDELKQQSVDVFSSKSLKKNMVEEWWHLFLLPIILGTEWLLRKRNGLY